MIKYPKKIFSKLIDPEDKKSIFIFFIVSFLIIFFQLVLLVYKINTQLKIPTVQTQAKLELIKFGQEEKRESRKLIFSNSLKKRIYLWPIEGIKIDKNVLLLKEKVKEVLSKDFSEDWKTLPIDEKKFFLEKTVSTIKEDLKRKIRDNFFLPKNISQSDSLRNSKNLSLISRIEGEM